MRQLITRIDEALHQQLRRRARADGRSVNSLVTDLLRKGLTEDDERARVRLLLEEGGVLVELSPRGSIPSREDAIESTRGVGDAASTALVEQRSRG